MKDETGTILVAEDSLTQAERLRSQLLRAGYQVEVVTNGEEGLARLQAVNADLILSDVMMPTMDGFAFCRAVKSTEATRTIPFVMVTSAPGGGDKARALEEGADDFLAKPVDPVELLARVRSLLRAKDFYDQLQASNAELQALTADLEERVAERTAELHTKNEEMSAMTQQLWQTAKLATMGELAASIAHELNNPLSTVSLRIESLIGQTPEDDAKLRSLRVIEGEVDRMGTLVANLLQFSRQSQQQISTIDLQDEVSRSLELVHYHLRNHQVAVVEAFATDAPMVQADRQQLRQIFLNLITNASDAMPDGGTLTIQIRKGDDASAVIEFIDTGIGIPAEQLSRVLEPFFTTKGEGKGTGLGLPICQRIIQEHRGTMEIISEVGVGTTLRIVLPAANGTNGALLRSTAQE